MHCRRARLAALVLIALAAAPAWAQQSTPLERLLDRFVLDSAVVNAGDLSADGRWLAGTTISTRNRIGIDNTRFQDPTYIAPSMTDVWVVDTSTGATRKIFTQKRQVRAMKWSPDGSRLALLVLNGGLFEPMIWDRATGAIRAVPLPTGTEAADNAEFEWSPTGAELFFSARAKVWRMETRQRFDEETGATSVRIHTSTEPILAWEDLRRSEFVRSVVAFDVAAGRSRDIVPQTRISSYRLLEDGSAFTYSEDITKKTDYDTIFGIENQVLTVPAAGGAARTILKSTKGLTIQWSRDGRTFAYSKDGKVFIGSLSGGDPKQVAGPTGDKDSKDAKDTKDPKEADEQRCTVVRVSQNGE